MSGIFGRYDFNKRSSDTVIEELGRWNSPYGDAGLVEWKDDYFFFGCFIERISKRNKNCSYLIEREKNIWAVDALLFNRDELVESESELLNSDEDIMISYICRHGLDNLKNVNGDFAGAIYDESAKRLILFRDHMGIRPLYYILDDKCVAFSTDIRGICGMNDYKSEINETWIYNLLSGYTNMSTENTSLNNVKCVPPGGFLDIDLSSGKVKKRLYWEVGEKRFRGKSDDEYTRGLRSIIEDSIKRRLDVCDDPIGAELSGGLDSGVIDILINRFGRNGIYYSWSATLEETPYVENDERLVIKDICDQENIECIFTSGKNVLDEDNSRMVEQIKKLGAFDLEGLQIPLRYAFPSFMNSFKITKGAEIVRNRGAKVMFTGHGGDEGVSHRATPFEMLYFHEYLPYIRYMWALTQGRRFRFLRTTKRIYSDVINFVQRRFKPYVSANKSPELMSVGLSRKKIKGLNLSFGYDPVEYIRFGGSRPRLDNVALQGGYCGIRYLIPFLDYRVVDYAVSIPRRMFLRGDQNRYIYREAFKDILPDSLYEQKIKSTTSITLAPKGDSSGWFDIFCKNRQLVFEKLDKDLWGQYLNFDFIEEWMKTGEPSEENLHRTTSIFYNMCTCLTVQNILEKSKKK